MSKDVAKRKSKKDFPLVSDLPRYGVDIPVPTSVDELKCVYNEDERTPLDLAELEGYCIPPEGIVRVWVNGVGARAGRGPMMYRPGTFREDKVTIGKEFGTTNKELLIAREQSKKDAIIDAVSIYLEDNKKLTLDTLKDKDPQVIAAAVIWALGIIDKSGSPREAFNFMKWLDSKLEQKGEVLDKLKGDKALDLATASVKMLDKYLVGIDELIESKKGEIVDIPFVGEPPPED